MSIVVPGLACAILAVALLPFFLVSVPPLSQYYDNLARMTILADPGAPFIRNFFNVRWGPIPDLAMDLTVPWLAQAISVETASKLFVIVALALIFSGTLALHRAIHGAFSPLPLVAGLFLYTWILVLGWANQLFGTGLMLWALAAWVALARRPPAVRAACGATFAIPIYFSHLFPLGVFGIVIAALEFSAWHDMPRRSWHCLVTRAITVAAPFLVPLCLLLLSSTAGHADETAYWWNRKLVHLVPLLMIGNPFTDWLLIASTGLIGGIALWRGWLKIAPPWRFVVAALLVTYLLIPWRIFGSYSAELRVAFTAIFLVIASLRLVAVEPRRQAAAALFLVVVFVIRISGVVHDWRAAAATLDSWRSGFTLLHPGSIVFVYAQDNRNPYPYERPSYWNPPLTKAVSLALLSHPVLVPKTYLVRGHQPVVYARPYESLHALETQPETIASRNDFLAWVAKLQARCPELRSLATAIYVAVRDPEGKLLPPPPGSQIIFKSATLYLLEMRHWSDDAPSRPEASASECAAHPGDGLGVAKHVSENRPQRLGMEREAAKV